MACHSIYIKKGKMKEKKADSLEKIDSVDCEKIDSVDCEKIDSVDSEQAIVKVISSGHFYCEDCKFRLKRTELNGHHTKCRVCYYPNKDRGKSLIIL
jgi:hypothetical protein